jgi:hypothetical protein
MADNTNSGRRSVFRCLVLAGSVVVLSTSVLAQVDPGARCPTTSSCATPGAGGQIPGLTVKEAKFFSSGQEAFGEVASVTGSVPNTEPGLGPRFNMNSCGGCHKHPAIGGTSPSTNPQVSVSTPAQTNTLTSLGIINASGPVREVRFQSDPGVHDLFTIVGLPGAPSGCNISQPDFAAHAASD